MNIELTRIADLTPGDWQLWLDIQQQDARYASPYFRPEFARAVAAVRDDVEVAVLKLGGQAVGFFPFQRGRLNLGKPLGGKLSDYHGPLVCEGVEVDPLELTAGAHLAAWDFDHLIGQGELFDPFITARSRSPQLDLSQGYAAYVEARKAAGSDTAARSGQKLRKLAREVGPISFVAEADDPEAFEQLLAWKSAQYLRTGLTDIFAFPWTRELLARLREHQGAEFSAPLSVLRAGDKLVAASISLRSQGVLHCWFNAYNPDLSCYSPGVLFLLQLAEQAQALGIATIDLGAGDERYKWSLASHGVEVGEGSLGGPSLAGWLRSGWRQARDWVKSSPLKDTAALPARLIKPVRQWLAYH